MITFDHFSFTYAAAGTAGAGGGREFALEDINLSIPQGDFLGIIGSSGAGKTTLLYAINGAIPHHFAGDFYGQVRVAGLDTIDAGTRALSRVTGTVFQDIDGQMTASVVEDEVLFGLENANIPRDHIEARMKAALEAAGIAHLRQRPLDSLSGGQKQKVAIAAITALRPAVLVLDEPTGELDPQSSRKIFEHLRDLNTRLGATIVIVEQKIMLLCEFAKHLAVLDRGHLASHGTVREALQRPAILQTAGVSLPRVTSLAHTLAGRGLYTGELPCTIGQAETAIQEILAQGGKPRVYEADTTACSGLAANGVEFCSAKASLMPPPPSRESQEGTAILRFESASFGYGGGETLRDISFTLETGSFTALLGENGAGKSTLCRLAIGLLKPSRGRILAAGSDTRTTKTSRIARDIGFLFQNPDRQLCQNTVRDEIRFGLSPSSLVRRRTKIRPGTPAAAAREAEAENRCAEMLELFKLPARASPFSLSRGERQLCALASVLARRPALLILDEPTTGLDYRECTAIMDHIARLNSAGKTVLMITHDMEVAADYARRVLVLSAGRLIADAPARDALRDRLLLTRAGLLPPQIAELAARFASLPALGAAFTCTEMADAVAAAAADMEGGAP
ncbi:MAG: energy-coupling factor ABC transporter ATP-binding protein [Spirochaetaceae bacterium]|jgi:energy-coupling factor transport system ATP-binding protein|nr:energy-coupling factor ABC transporter ATP-binding protein [Spirochaetaceae bacterium]